jgi:hypothetical protein
MLLHFFKTAFRNLKANKVYSILTVAGLGVGIAVFLVIFLFIRYQQSYDAGAGHRDFIGCAAVGLLFACTDGL